MGGHGLAGLAAAELQHQARRDLGAPNRGLGIEAALEAVAGVRQDGELAPGGGDANRFEQRDLEEGVGGRLGAARGLAAHDPADALGAVRIGDHHHLLVEAVGLAVERQDLLAATRHAHGEIARDLVGVEDVERAAQVVGHVVGHVDQRRDRAQADGAQARLQPRGAGAVPEVAEQASGDEGAGVRFVPGQVALPAQGALEGPGHGRDVERLEFAEAGRRQVARDAAHAQAVLTVGCDRNLDHRIVKAEQLGKWHAQFGIVRHFNNALMIVRQAHFPL